jgi:hypothetical protein
VLFAHNTWAIREAPLAEHKTVSMQESTTGAVAEFMEREGCECLQSIKLLSFLAGALQRYEEEGVVLNPRVLLCNRIETFSRSLPGGRFLVLGQLGFSNDAGKHILKQCATLARAGWTIFVERNAAGTEARFGVLSSLASPTSIELRDMVALGRDPSLGSPELAVLVEQIDPRTVLFSGSRGNTLRIAFSTTRITKDEASEVRQFSDLCCSNVDSPEFKAYFCSILGRSLKESHGTILVCRSSRQITKVKGMNQAVLLDPPLDLKDAFMAYKTLGSADSILELQRSEALLIGMLQSDGIVVFDDQGAITAYRVIFQDTRAVSAKGNRGRGQSAASVGGSRRKAFEGIKALVGQELRGAFFRSQDGATEFLGV